jgi:hypothetical protein
MKKLNFSTRIFFPGRVLRLYLRPITAVTIFSTTPPEAVQPIGPIMLKIKLTFVELKKQGFAKKFLQPSHLFHMEQYLLKNQASTCLGSQMK